MTREKVDIEADQSGHLWATCMAIALCGAAPCVVVLATGAAPAMPGSGWAAAVCVLAGANYATLGLRGASLYEVSWWMFVYVFFGLAPLVQIRTGVFPSTTPGVDPALHKETFLIVLGGCLAYMTGQHVGRQEIVPQDATAIFRRRRVTGLAVVAIATGWTYILAVGPTAFLSPRSELFAARRAAWSDPALLNLVTSAAVGLLLVSIAALVLCARSSRALLVLAVVTLLYAVNPISSPRYLFGTVGLSLAAMIGAFSTPRRFRITAASMLVAMVLVFPYADRFRTTESRAVLAKGDPVVALSNGDYDAFAQVNNAALYVHDHGPTWGRQAAGVALFWVPRSAWPGKPQDTGVLLAESRGYGFTNLSAPLWAEMFVNGDWPLLLIGMACLGAYVRRWGHSARGSARVLRYILPFYLIILLRGSLLQATALLSVLVAAAWFVGGSGQDQIREGHVSGGRGRAGHDEASRRDRGQIQTRIGGA